MKNFKDFNIKAERSSFTGDKIKISKILNRKIVVLGYKVDKSKYDTDICLCINFELNGTKHVVFTSSKFLLSGIEQVPKDSFPFEATIIEENEAYLFS